MKRRLKRIQLLPKKSVYGILIAFIFFLTWNTLSRSNNESIIEDINGIVEKALANGIGKVSFHDDYLHIKEYPLGPDIMWEQLITNGREKMERSNYSKHLVMFEVGAHRAQQSVGAAKAKFHTHVIEPSPRSFDSIRKRMSKVIRNYPELQEYIHLHNVVAGSTSGQMVEFTATGGTGDHVGRFDVWNMTTRKSDEDTKSKTVQVKSMKLDDLINNDSIENEPTIDEVYAMKIDTQGYELHVLSGLKESLKKHKIQYVLTEFWPKGLALINNRTDTCDFAMETLYPLISAGYSIYALAVEGHASIRKYNIDDDLKNWKERPFDDLRADCEYLLNLEKRYPLEWYHMGYWTDYLFIAPNAPPIHFNS